MEFFITGLVGLIAAGVTALTTLYVQNRRYSGDIRLTTPERLWDAHDKMLDRQATELSSLRDRVTRVEESNRELTRENYNLHETVRLLDAELEKAKQKIAALETENATKGDEIIALREKNQDLQAHIDKLETR